MIGHIVVYIRMSSFDQNPSRQLEGLALDRIFFDKASGKDTRCPELENLKQMVILSLSIAWKELHWLSSEALIVAVHVRCLLAAKRCTNTCARSSSHAASHFF